MDRRWFLQKSYQLSGMAMAGWLSASFENQSPALAAPVKSKIAWKNELQAAHVDAVEKNKPVLIVFTATWCAYCHKLIKEIGSDNALVSMINEQFVPTLLDFDKESHIAKVLEVEVLPTTVVLSPQVELLMFKAGYLKTGDYQKLLASALKKQPEIRAAGATSLKRQ